MNVIAFPLEKLLRIIMMQKVKNYILADEKEITT